MNNQDQQKRRSIQAELRAIESLNDSATDREQLHRREDNVARAVEDIKDPVLQNEFRRRLSVLRGEP